jgi:hypothetical protein
MEVCECGHVPDCMGPWVAEVYFCPQCRQVDSTVDIDECLHCEFATDVTELCGDCQQKVREAFGTV